MSNALPPGIVVEIIETTSSWAEVVVSAAVQLFQAGDPVEVLLQAPRSSGSSSGPSLDLAELVQRWVVAAVDDPARLPEVLLVNAEDILGRTELVRVTTGVDAPAAARSVALLTGVALSMVEPSHLPAKQVSPRAAASPRSPQRHDGLEHAVLFSSFGGGRVACNPMAIAHELERVGHDATRYFVVPDAAATIPPGCLPVLRGSADHARALTRSRWLVDNQELPTGYVKRPGQEILQTWHGTALKLLLRDLHETSPRRPDILVERLRDAAQWDYAISPNPLMSGVLPRALGAGGTVLELGYPRDDVLADPARRCTAAARVRSALRIPHGRPVVMFAPTWRFGSLPGLDGIVPDVVQPSPDWALLRELLDDDVTILSRQHRFMPGVASTGAAVRDVTAWPDMTELLAATDILVTDYSSSFFDFALTGRPMVFFAHDLEEYRGSERGHYFVMEDVVPGPLTTTPDEAARAIAETVRGRRARLEPYRALYRSFNDTFNPWNDGSAASRVVEEVFA